MTTNFLFDRLLSAIPNGKLISVNVGLYWTAVVVEVHGKIQCGLAATMGDDSHHYSNEPSIPRAGSLMELPTRDLAALVHSDTLPQVSIGMATINALLPRLEERWVDIHAEDVIARHAVGKNVAMVGHFPFVSRLRPRVGRLWVLEQNPLGDDLPAAAAAEIIPQADVIAITATTLLNHTFDDLIALRRPDALTLLMGPTTPLSPILFEHGLSIISGALVDDIESTLRGVTQGANFHQLRRLGVRLVSMTADPMLIS